MPIFSKLAKQVSGDALDEYVLQLEKEVNKYLSKDPNYGKAAKRMYNIFRLTGLYEEAAYIRELFDEPASMLYQVWSLIRTIDDCANPPSPARTGHERAQGPSDMAAEPCRKRLRSIAIEIIQSNGKAPSRSESPPNHLSQSVRV